MSNIEREHTVGSGVLKEGGNKTHLLEPTGVNLETTFKISEWEDKIKKAASARINFEQQWYENLAFYRGKQWVQWANSPIHESGRALVQPKSARKRLVFNRIMPIVRREFTKLTKEEPQYFVQPNTTDQSDIAAAQTGEAIAEYLAFACSFNKARRSAIWWATQCGTGFIKTTYSESDTLPVGQGGAEMGGKIIYESPSPFHIFVPYLELEDIQDQPWVYHQRAYDPGEVEEVYGKKIEPKAEISTSNTETRFRNAINIKQQNTAKQVLVKEIWIKPCKTFPTGNLVVWAEGVILLETQEFPYKHGEFPFQKITHIPSGGFYGISTIEGLIPMQKEYNLTKSQLSEARDLTSKPALVAVKGSVDIKKLKAVPGAVIEYMPGADPPRRLINPDMPTYIDRLIDMLLDDFTDHAAQYEVSKGTTPPGLEAASAIAYLQEQNDDMLYHTIASMEEAVSQSGRQSLSLVQQYWPQTRIINTISKTHLQGAIEFKGSDLKNNIDLRVVSDSMAPRSRAAKQASVIELVKLGAVEPNMALKYFQMSETSAMYDELHTDINQVKRENLRLARGEQFEPNKFDDHRIHVQEHQTFQKTQEYELLPDETKAFIDQHVEMHMTIEVAQTLKGNNGPGTNAEPTDGEPISAGDEQPGDPGAI